MSRSVLARAGVLLTATGAVLVAGGATAWADPVSAAAPVVDIAVERTLSTPTNLFDVSPTRGADVDISLENRGGAAQDAEFGFAVPAGWTVTPAYDLPADETCALSAGTYTCTVTALPVGQARSTQLLVTAAATDPVGGVTTVTVAGGPIGAVDSDPSNNSTQFRFQNVGTSVVTPTITQSATTVAPGGTVDFAVTLTNAGPDRTVGQSAFVHVLTQTPDAVTQLTPTGPGQIEAGGDADAPNAGPSYTWTIDLDPGQSATLHISWRGEVLGASAVLEVRSSHQPENSPGTDTVERARSQPVTVAVAAAQPPASAPTGGPSGGPVLAATGTQHVVALAGTGSGLVVAGGLLVLLTRRRFTTGRR